MEFKHFKASEAKRVLARTEPYPADVDQVKEYALAILTKFPYYNVRTYVVYIVANKGYRFWEV